MSARKEKDTLGEVPIPADRYWGINTQRSLQHFAIGEEHFDWQFICHLIAVKRAAAVVNHRLNRLDQQRYRLILQACDDLVSDSRWQDEFPLFVWQTGSGTQTNMNVNEVIANRGNELAGGKKGEFHILHPNDHVNMSQSSNDVFPSAMHITVADRLQAHLLPELSGFIRTLNARAEAFAAIRMVGRTHLMDALPIRLGDAFGAFSQQLQDCHQGLSRLVKPLLRLAIGGTAVGTGANSPPGFAGQMADELASQLGLPISSHPDKFAALSAEDDLVKTSGELRLLATILLKLANDIRLLASGPRCGIGELQLPVNEAGSSIMPGKANPTQCEALSMIAIQVMANDQAIAFAGSQGQLQLNVYRPLILYNCCQSLRLLTDGIHHFNRYCVEGLAVNQQKLDQHNANNIMTITLLAPELGYDQAARIAKHAYQHNCSLSEAAEALGLFSASDFNEKLQRQLAEIDRGADGN